MDVGEGPPFPSSLPCNKNKDRWADNFFQSLKFSFMKTFETVNDTCYEDLTKKFQNFKVIFNNSPNTVQRLYERFR